MVTPYEIDMRFANIINKGDGKDSGKDLYAANADGNYIGFMGATSWEGFYLQEADGTVWHTAKSGSMDCLMDANTQCKWHRRRYHDGIQT